MSGADTAAMAARNRRLIAERLHHPDGTVDACEELEARFPGWHVWWSRDPIGDPQPGYRAQNTSPYSRQETLQAASPYALAALIKAADQQIAAEWRRFDWMLP